MRLKRSVILLLIAIGNLGVSSCEDRPPGAPDFRWTPKAWATDSRTRQLIRGTQRVRCEEEKFDDFVCYPQSAESQALAEYYRIINLCDKWK